MRRTFEIAIVFFLEFWNRLFAAPNAIEFDEALWFAAGNNVFVAVKRRPFN